MDASHILDQMCHQVLSNVDVNAIRKSRGFSAQETASRALLENFFLSDTGVEAALDSLTREEVALLHLLRLTGEAVNVAFFHRIYGDKSASRYYSTFTQRYKGVFKQIRLCLVRKGVLLVAEDKSAWNADTKMERWRFRFPQEFELFLPPLIRSPRMLEGAGLFRTDVLRDKLREIVTGKRPSPVASDKQYDLRLVGGELRMGNKAFRAEHLQRWQRACWQAAVPLAKKQQAQGDKSKEVSPAEAATYIFSQLREHEWIRPGQLSEPLRIFCNAHPSGEQICTAGWQWGYLAKQDVDGAVYYRPVPDQEKAAVEMDPKFYLHVFPGRPVDINLDTIPYKSLEYLARLSSFQVATDHLQAVPNLIKIGAQLDAIRNHTLTRWLRENIPAFRQALETAEQRWGKQIIHENILIAQIADLGLQVRLERAFPDSRELVILPNDYIAFPTHLLAAVEKVVAKSGHVIRTVQHHV